jgi:hypothetical protein
MDLLPPKTEDEEPRLMTVFNRVHQFADYVLDFNRAAARIQRPE